jgi:glycosyltransferase involved in cell wall biosynthesis
LGIAPGPGGRHIARVKILVNCTIPFALAHGGQAIQIQQTMAALNAIGVVTEPLRWWDEQQAGDLIHYFGVPPLEHIRLAHTKGIPVVSTHLFTAACNRPAARLRLQGWMIRSFLKLPLGEGIKQQLNWRSFQNCRLNIVGLAAEQRVLELAYGIPPEQVAVVPLGLDAIFLNAGRGDRSADYLLCAGTITRRKNSVALARLAHAAQVPILFVGKPYSASEPYWREFSSLVDGRWVRHHPHVAEQTEMVSLLKSARGAVVMSAHENWCLTAHEAIACGLPLLVQDQKWSRERFGNQVRYFKSIGYSPENVTVLKQFYDEAPGLPAPNIKLYSWAEVATQLKAVYQKVLNREPAT